MRARLAGRDGGDLTPAGAGKGGPGARLRPEWSEPGQRSHGVERGARGNGRCCGAWRRQTAEGRRLGRPSGGRAAPGVAVDGGGRADMKRSRTAPEA